MDSKSSTMEADAAEESSEEGALKGNTKTSVNSKNYASAPKRKRESEPRISEQENRELKWKEEVLLAEQAALRLQDLRETIRASIQQSENAVLRGEIAFLNEQIGKKQAYIRVLEAQLLARDGRLPY
ncbi:hypothetical protein BDZ45DRAFT_803815 [Acephala macrosclerotiorum]|nr:hypothetical protein BDZ45DRAFT_803815 [Acephala macrosclerotiorum]